MEKLKTFNDFDNICKMIIGGEKIPIEILMQKTRKREVVFVRQLCMYFGMEETTLSQSRIGSYFGKDHATAIHARKAINDLIDTDREVRAKVERYRVMVTSTLLGLDKKRKTEMVKFWIRHKIPLFVREQKLLSFGKACSLCGQSLNVCGIKMYVRAKSQRKINLK